MENKRGQGLSTNAIIMIILGIVVLVVLILGFTLGWGKILPFLSSENVDSVVNGCNTACVQGNTYAFCSQQRELVDAEGNEFASTCYLFSNLDNFSKYGIDKCSSIKCELDCGDLKIGDNSGINYKEADVIVEVKKGYDVTSLAEFSEEAKRDEKNQCWIKK